jgi:hypothetical protein
VHQDVLVPTLPCFLNRSFFNYDRFCHSKKGPLGELEEQAVAIVEKLTKEEKERLRNINRFLNENRPMGQDKTSFLGILETVAVGIFRAPILIYQIIVRVNELLDSQTLSTEDADLLEQNTKKDRRD